MSCMQQGQPLHFPLFQMMTIHVVWIFCRLIHCALIWIRNIDANVIRSAPIWPYECSVICSLPFVHHSINVLKCTITGKLRYKPCCWPGWICSFIQYLMDIFRQNHTITFAICRTGPIPSTKLTLTIVSGIWASVLKWDENPPPLNWQSSAGHQSVARRHAWISSSFISHHFFHYRFAIIFLCFPCCIHTGGSRIN